MTKKYDSQNIFAKILDGSIPSDPIWDSETTFAFADINPQAASHSLVIPKGAYSDLTHFASMGSDKELADWVRALAGVAKAAGLSDSGYRVVVNCGADAHQEVPHLHGHVLGGQALGAILGGK